MKNVMLAAIATSALMGIGSAAQAQAWNSIENRARDLDPRIYAGIRSGQITEAEATRLRSDVRDVVRLEQRYSAGGLDYRERADLDRRWETISSRVYAERHDSDRARQARWDNLNKRQAMFDQRLRRAVRDQRLSQRQADSLRAEFRQLAQLERQYRRGGLTVSERADLDQRMDRLQTRFRSDVNANQYGYGYGQAPNLFDYLFGIR